MSKQEVCETITALKPEPGKLYVLKLPSSAYFGGTESLRARLTDWWAETFPDCNVLLLPPDYEFKEADDAMLAEIGLTRIAARHVVCYPPADGSIPTPEQQAQMERMIAEMKSTRAVVFPHPTRPIEYSPAVTPEMVKAGVTALAAASVTAEGADGLAVEAIYRAMVAASAVDFAADAPMIAIKGK